MRGRIHPHRGRVQVQLALNVLRPLADELPEFQVVPEGGGGGGRRGAVVPGRWRRPVLVEAQSGTPRAVLLR